MQTITAETNDHQSFEDKELQYWSSQLGVTVQELKEAIEKVGLEVDAVAAYLKEKKKSWNRSVLYSRYTGWKPQPGNAVDIFLPSDHEIYQDPATAMITTDSGR